MNSNRKLFTIILTVLALIIFAYVLNRGKKPIPTEGLTSTWETFEYNGKDFPYPPTWTFEEILDGENGKDIISVLVYKKSSENKEINVMVGGEKGCEELRDQKLCLGKNPVYTDSQDPEAMQLFELYVRINENPQ
jgi:hypothetical protein